MHGALQRAHEQEGADVGGDAQLGLALLQDRAEYALGAGEQVFFEAGSGEAGAAPEYVPQGCEQGQLARYHKWKANSTNLRSMLEYNRNLQKAKKEGADPRALPPPPAAEVDLRVPCPHCKRKFNKEVAERHIPKCHAANPRMKVR